MPPIQDFAARVSDNVERVIVGKRDAIELFMVALLCEGHVLIEDVPGVGKTMLARSMLEAMQEQQVTVDGVTRALPPS